jgi:P-type E1-E2 ATPase
VQGEGNYIILNLRNEGRKEGQTVERMSGRANFMLSHAGLGAGAVLVILMVVRWLIFFLAGIEQWEIIEVLISGISIVLITWPNCLPYSVYFYQKELTQKLTDNCLSFSNPRSFERLLSVTDLILNKTGTITLPLMTVTKLFPGITDNLPYMKEEIELGDIIQGDEHRASLIEGLKSTLSEEPTHPADIAVK